MTIQRRDIPGLPHAALRVAAVFVIASLPLAGGCDQRAGAPDSNTAIPPSPAIHQEKPREIPPQEAQPMTNPPTSPASAQDDAYQEALHDAASTDPARHAALRARLTDPAFLGQLDTAADYQAPARTLRIAGVLKELIDNRTPVSDETLNTLASNAEFVSVYARQDLAIRAMAYVRPASKEAVELWKVHSTPK
ncbi:MAG: hypothetical protein ACOYN0_09450, partial [Phycisphaerales bacterium]